MTAILAIPDAQKSRLQALRNTNDCPDDQEIQGINDLAATLRQASAVLASRIAVLQAELAGIVEEKARTDALLNDIAAVLHPSRRLPQEILSNIFSIALNSFPIPMASNFNTLSMVDSLHRSYPAWVLSKVSSRWRRAALGNSSIWSRLILSFDSSHWEDNALNISFLLMSFLSRSGNQPIILHLGSMEPDALYNHPALPILLMSCHRWQHAFICIHWSDYAVLESAPSPFTHLEFLYLLFRQSPPLDWTCEAFKESQTPKLRNISSNLPRALLSQTMPWSQIHEYLHGGTATPEDHSANLRLLGKLTSVRKLVLNTYAQTPTPSPFTKTVLPELLDICLFGPATGIQDICGRLSAPKLSRFRLRSDAPLDEVLTPDLEVIGGTACKHVVLCMQRGDEEEVRALRWLFGVIPGIHYLQIRLGAEEEGTNIGGICEALAARGQQTIGKELKGVTVTSPNGFGVDERLISMILSRRSGENEVMVLHRVRMLGVIDCPEDVTTSLAQLRSTGFESNVTSI